MATLDYTGDGNTAAPDPFSANSKEVTLYRRLKVATIIAADATMTSNGYIAIGDVIQAIDVPAGFVFDKAVMRIITACTTSANVEVGLDGGAEAIASFDVDGTAGTCAATIETDSWAGGQVFTSADTIDVEFITANCVIGELELWVFGKMLKLGSA
jgi:hypothetical protein